MEHFPLYYFRDNRKVIGLFKNGERIELAYGDLWNLDWSYAATPSSE